MHCPSYLGINPSNIHHTIYRLETHPMNLIYQVWHWFSLGIHSQAARTTAALVDQFADDQIVDLIAPHLPQKPPET